MKNFIAQRRVKLELSAIADSLLKFPDKHVNILIRGSAGSGKTLLARLFLNKVCDNFYSEQIPAEYNNKFVFTKNIEGYRGHFVDEVHTIKNFETLYPYMDLKKYIFIFASNESGVLPDAFVSRCIMFTLDDYTENDIIKIVLLYSKEINFNLTKDTAKLIANRSRLSPRIAKQYVDRINFLISSGYRPKTLRGITTAFNDIGIREGGYTELDIKYMDTLSKLGVTSLQNISRILKIDKDTITNSIEPFLLEKGHIEITAKGRRFIEW